MIGALSVNTFNTRLLLGGGFLLALVLVALSAPWIAPHDPFEQDLLSQNMPPFWMTGHDPKYTLGSDGLGRDILSRLIWGTRPFCW